MASESGLLGPAQIRSLAASLDLTPTKRHGQNFVIDPNTVRRIVRMANVTPNDVVLEIGPGLGSLTLGLLESGARVHAIEIDHRLAEVLADTVAQRMPQRSPALWVTAADAMAVELAADQAPVQPATPPPPLPTTMVANLPYNVAVPIVLRMFAQLPSLARGLVMVQLEVAQRLAATPGSRVYGVPSVKMQWFGHVEFAGTVGPSVFWPAPRVDSGLVRITRHAPPDSEAGRERVFGVIDAAFSQRRKKLRSALATWAGGVQNADHILELASVDPSARGEDLTLASFVSIADARLQVDPA